MVIFVWGASLFATHPAPAGRRACRSYVVGKQWMWKLQHLEGRREINELHVPVGQPVKLTHDLRGRDPQLLRAGLPHQAGRGARAATPRTWFEATKAGELPPLLRRVLRHRCTPGMIGQVVVMEPAEYQAWLPEPRRRRPPGGRRVSARRRRPGEALFQQRRAAPPAIAAGQRPRGPPLGGLVRQARCTLAGRQHRRGRRRLPARVDPEPAGARSSRASQPIMPTFQGQLSEEKVLQLIAYIKSLEACGRERRQTAPSDRRPPSIQTAPAPTGVNYLNADYGIRSWLLTIDHKRIAILYLISITVIFFLGGLFAAVHPARAARRPPADLRQARHLQQALHDARHRHGVLLPDPVDPGRARATS